MQGDWIADERETDTGILLLLDGILAQAEVLWQEENEVLTSELEAAVWTTGLHHAALCAEKRDRRLKFTLSSKREYWKAAEVKTGLN